MNEPRPTTPAETLRWASRQFVGADAVFDHDADNAFVAARLEEMAETFD